MVNKLPGTDWPTALKYLALSDKAGCRQLT